LALAKFRAIEHRRFLVRSTNTGVSAIVDPLGGLVTHSGTFVTDAKLGDVRWMKSRTVYETTGDAPWYVASLAVAVAAFRRRRPRAGSGSGPAATPPAKDA